MKIKDIIPINQRKNIIKDFFTQNNILKLSEKNFLIMIYKYKAKFVEVCILKLA